MPDERDSRDVELWRQLSTLVHTTRANDVPLATGAQLDGVIERDQEGTFTAAYELWAADNHYLAWDFAEASRRYEALQARADRLIVGDRVDVLAAERRSDCLYLGGEVDAAIEERRRLAERPAAELGDQRSRAQLLARAGELAEAAGSSDRAAELFQVASERADHPSLGSVFAADLARRNLERLRSPRSWMRADPDQLAAELVEALVQGAADRLRGLLSPTHAVLGALGGEGALADSDALLDVLLGDLSTSTVIATPSSTDRSGQRIYLETRGWQGSLFTGSVVLLLARSAYGYEWIGAALHGLPVDEAASAAWQRIRREGVDPDDAGHVQQALGDPLGDAVDLALAIAGLKLKCPWPAPMDFRAGGIIPFAAQNAAILAGATLAGPFYWAAVALGYAIAAGASPCGFGPGGLFYGQAPTHTADEQFAIDFSHFIRGIPFALNARGTPVLAATAGVVSSVVSSIPTGNTSSMANEAQILHMERTELGVNAVIALFTGQPIPFRFTGCYLHLMGPGLMPVSPGMFLEQGSRIGFLDSTGRSLGDHLHFSLHDRKTPFTGAAFFPGLGASVPPSPMDGMAIGDGSCLHSTNVPRP